MRQVRQVKWDRCCRSSSPSPMHHPSCRVCRWCRPARARLGGWSGVASMLAQVVAEGCMPIQSVGGASLHGQDQTRQGAQVLCAVGCVCALAQCSSRHNKCTGEVARLSEARTRKPTGAPQDCPSPLRIIPHKSPPEALHRLPVRCTRLPLWSPLH